MRQPVCTSIRFDCPQELIEQVQQQNFENGMLVIATVVLGFIVMVLTVTALKGEPEDEEVEDDRP